MLSPSVCSGRLVLTASILWVWLPAAFVSNEQVRISDSQIHHLRACEKPDHNGVLHVVGSHLDWVTISQ